MMIDSASALQNEVPNGPAADKFLGVNRFTAAHIDANDILYSLKSSFSYDPAADLSKIKTKLFALNFYDDEFNPDRLQVLQTVVPKLEHGRYVVQPGTPSSPGHFTMTRPDLWAQHVDEFMRWLNDAPSAGNYLLRTRAAAVSSECRPAYRSALQSGCGGSQHPVLAIDRRLHAQASGIAVAACKRASRM